jgi:transcription elongation factor Elf1
MLNILLKVLKPRKVAMNRRRPNEDFNCSKCGAQYKLVRMPAPGNSLDPQLHCKICNQELASTDGENVLKYFLVGRHRHSRPPVAGTR